MGRIEVILQYSRKWGISTKFLLSRFRELCGGGNGKIIRANRDGKHKRNKGINHSPHGYTFDVTATVAACRGSTHNWD